MRTWYPLGTYVTIFIGRELTIITSLTSGTFVAIRYMPRTIDIQNCKFITNTRVQAELKKRKGK